MHKDDTTPPDCEKLRMLQAEIDYAPKKHALDKQIVFGLKLAAFAAILFLVIWYFER